MPKVYDTIAFVNAEKSIFQLNCFDCRLKEGGFSQPTSGTLKKTPSKT
jgi:hypothetical protein